ncbi:hypothetical protein ACLOJK_033009 [Asimina triloba]
MEPLRPLRLRCSVQNYDWGLAGEESTAAKLFSLNSQSKIDPDKPYAEFWMGTHPSGPSYVVGTAMDVPDGVVVERSVSLKKWIDANADALGERVVEKWGRDLPFLFKVLSIAKALSIQAHPDKELARILHKAWPNVYKDSNHKPEMALAITEFGALCGFVSFEELKGVIIDVPEIVELVGPAIAEQVLNFNEEDGEEKAKAVLQLIFTHLMTANKDAVFETVSKLKTRLNAENKIRVLTEKEQLVLILEKQYPADIGVLSAFFLNYVKLNPGEALYLGANEPHAYIYGECIECMATSDNVVRAGLTPKFRDVQTLCSMLTYRQGFPEILQGIPINAYTRRYLPPFDEFEVDRCHLPSGVTLAFPAIPGPSILFVIAGEGSMRMGPPDEEDGMLIRSGDVFFIPAESKVSVTGGFGDDDTSVLDAGALQIYRAGVSSRFFN